MITCERGKIRNRNHIPVKDFSGLRFGKITPTDIDGFMEFNDQFFIFIEIKFGMALLKTDQRLALERTCNALKEAGKISVLLVARYQVQNPTEVYVSDLPLSNYYYPMEWHKPSRELTMRQAVEEILAWHPNKIKELP